MDQKCDFRRNKRGREKRKNVLILSYFNSSPTILLIDFSPKSLVDSRCLRYIYIKPKYDCKIISFIHWFKFNCHSLYKTMKMTQTACLMFLLMLLATTYIAQGAVVQAREGDGVLHRAIHTRGCVASFKSCSGIPKCCCGYCDMIGGNWGYCTC